MLQGIRRPVGSCQCTPVQICFAVQSCQEVYLVYHKNYQMFYQDIFQVVWARLWDALLGSKPHPVIRDYHIIVTIFYIFFTITLCRLLRLLNKRFAPKPVQELIGDILATFQCLSCGLENGMVRKAYGMGAYCVQTFFLGLWSQWTLEGSSGNPVRSFIKLVEGKRKLLPSLLHMTCQMIAGIVAYHYARTVWYFELSSEHIARRLRDAECYSDLNVPVMMGLFIELAATVIDVLVSKTTTKKFMFERYEQFAKGVFSICMTICGLNLTGMYLNPANATIQTYGCRGNSRAEYIVVYWCGPLIGAAIGIFVHQKLRQAYLALKRSFQASPDLTRCGATFEENRNVTDSANDVETKKDL
ncbi:aquaporin-11-like isoform X2 [Lineus longissimus]|uniref:aquaporin-11-like isoform X2 n=1 Tax=Lineus longissimus TaxID=88925 RepID=UPI002B4CBCCE